MRLSGKGMAAITTVGDPVMLRVSPHEPLMTDMNATVAWSGSLAPQFKTDIAARTLIGRGSGESIQNKNPLQKDLNKIGFPLLQLPSLH